MMLLALSVSALSLRGVRVMSDIEREEFEQAVTDRWSDSYSFTRFGMRITTTRFSKACGGHGKPAAKLRVSLWLINTGGQKARDR